MNGSDTARQRARDWLDASLASYDENAIAAVAELLERVDSLEAALRRRRTELLHVARLPFNKQSIEVIVMAALDLVLDEAFHDGSPRDLAVAAEAYTVAGYHDGAIMISHGGGHDVVMERVAAARKGRHKKALRAEATGMVKAFEVLARNDVIDHAVSREAARQRWLARGGHDRAAAVLVEETPETYAGRSLRGAGKTPEKETE